MANSRKLTGRIIGIVFVVLVIGLGFTFVESCHTSSDVREGETSQVDPRPQTDPVS